MAFISFSCAIALAINSNAVEQEFNTWRKAGILVLMLVLGRKLFVFHLWVWCSLSAIHIWTLSTLLSVFIMKGCCLFQMIFFYISGDDCEFLLLPLFC
jgi:hypothetical protein